MTLSSQGDRTNCKSEAQRENMTSREMSKALHQGCGDGDLLLVSNLLDQQGADVNVKDEQGRTALHLAAMQNNQRLAEVLFQHGANTCVVSDHCQMPLDCASEDDMVLLLAKMMVTDGKDALVRKRLKYLNKPELFKQKIIAELERVPQEKQAIPLLTRQVGKPRAVFTDMYGMLESVSQRLSPSNKSDCSQSSLSDSGYSDMDKIDSLSSVFSPTETMQTKSRHGKHRNLPQQRRATSPLALQEISALNTTRTRALAETRTAVKTTKERRKTLPTRPSKTKKQVTFGSDVILDVAVANDEFVEACHLIKSRKVDINRRGPNGLTPLHRAAIEGSYDCLQLLIDQGANIDITDEKGWTPLHDAVYHNNTSSVLALLKAGANVTVQTKDFLGVVELSNDEGMLLVVGRALVLYELGFVSDIVENVTDEVRRDLNRESCV